MKLYKHWLSTGWTFRDRDTEEWMSVPAVPFVVQQDLIANKKLEAPFIGFNELKANWVNEQSWVYRNVFQRPNVPRSATIDLVFDGLDAFAAVKLDDETILQSDNMFLGHRINVTKALETEGEHTLEIEFDCALLKARELRNEDQTHRWVALNADPSRLAVRKAQYHWGWDWGPVLMTAGIWRAVRLEVYTARIIDLSLQTRLAADHQTAEVTAVIKVNATATGVYILQFRLESKGCGIQQDGPITTSHNTAEVTYRLNRPELWWPHGYGEQALYEVSVSLAQNGEPVDEVSKKFGIRTAEVIQKRDKHGKSFFFRINGIDIFCAGSCWIPADSLLPNISAERYRRWIELMVEGRQNMIRVWGGGIYEDDSFYEA